MSEDVRNTDTGGKQDVAEAVVKHSIAEALVEAAAEDDSIICSNCGEEVDLSEANSSIQVLAVLQRHKERNHE